MFPSRADRKATVTATIRNAQGSKLVVHARGLQNRESGFESRLPCLKSHTVYRTFRTDQRREFVRITEDVADAVSEAAISEGMVLVAAMHITAAVWINDDEPGIQADALEWLDKLAPPSWKEPDGEVAGALLPNPGDYRHHRGRDDNGDAQLKNLLHH